MLRPTCSQKLGSLSHRFGSYWAGWGGGCVTLARARGVFVVVMGGLLAFSRFFVTVISVILAVILISIVIIIVVAFVISRASVASVASCAPRWEWSPCLWALWYWRARIEKASYQLIPIFFIGGFVNPVA